MPLTPEPGPPLVASFVAGSSFYFCHDVLNRLLVVDVAALTFG